MIEVLNPMLVINIMTLIMKNSSREIETYTLTLYFNHMSLFKRKRCCWELIAIKNGNLVFNLNNPTISTVHHILRAMMRRSGIFDENLYFDLYKEYQKHYVIYDVVPALLQYKVPLIFSGRFHGILFDNQFTFEELVPDATVYRKLPDTFKLPKNLEEILLKVRERVSAYIDMEDLSDKDYRDLVRMNFVKQWDIFKKDPSLIDCYMDAQLGMIQMWARVENKTIVKNIIERTQDELAQEFFSKNDEYGK
nr:MAG: hypothetical protein [Bacteriophage sp.]